MNQSPIEQLLKEENDNFPDKTQIANELISLLDNHPTIYTPTKNIGEFHCIDIANEEKNLTSISPPEQHFFISILRNTKFDVHKAVKKWENFMRLSQSFNEFLSWDSKLWSISEQMLSEGIVYPLRERDTMGRCVIVFEIAKRDPSVFQGYDLWRLIVHLTAVLMINDIDLSVCGFVYLFDGSNIGLQHLPSMRDMHFLSKSTNGSIPRIQKVILYKFPKIMSASVKLGKKIITQKMRDRIEIADSVDDVHKILPKSILPLHLGGDEDVDVLIKAGQLIWTSKVTKMLVDFMRECRVKM